MFDHWLPFGDGLLTLGVLIGVVRLHQLQRQREREMQTKLASMASLLARVLESRSRRGPEASAPLTGGARAEPTPSRRRQAQTISPQINNSGANAQTTE